MNLAQILLILFAVFMLGYFLGTEVTSRDANRIIKKISDAHISCFHAFCKADSERLALKRVNQQLKEKLNELDNRRNASIQ